MKRLYFVAFVRTETGSMHEHHTYENNFLDTLDEITMLDIKNFESQQENTAMGGKVTVTFFHEVTNQTKLKAAS